MGSDLVKADTSVLTGAAPSFTTKAGLVEDFASQIKAALNGLSDALAGIPELGHFDSSLMEVGGNANTIFDCYSGALQRVGHGLIKTSESFQKTDAELATTLKAIEVGLEPFIGYEVPVPTSPAKQPDTPWYETAGKWLTGIGVGIATFARNVGNSGAVQGAEHVIQDVEDSGVVQDTEQVLADVGESGAFQDAKELVETLLGPWL